MWSSTDLVLYISRNYWQEENYLNENWSFIKCICLKKFCQDATWTCNTWHNGRLNLAESFNHEVENVNWNSKMQYWYNCSCIHTRKFLEYFWKTNKYKKSRNVYFFINILNPVNKRKCNRVPFSRWFLVRFISRYCKKTKKWTNLIFLFYHGLIKKIYMWL